MGDSRQAHGILLIPKTSDYFILQKNVRENLSFVFWDYVLSRKVSAFIDFAVIMRSVIIWKNEIQFGQMTLDVRARLGEGPSGVCSVSLKLRFIMSLVSIYSSSTRRAHVSLCKSRLYQFALNASIATPICAFTTSFGWLMAHEIDPDRKCVIYLLKWKRGGESLQRDVGSLQRESSFDVLI